MSEKNAEDVAAKERGYLCKLLKSQRLCQYEPYMVYCKGGII